MAQLLGTARKAFITALGFVLLISGIILSLPLIPGPGLLIGFAGLALLSREYAWAERPLQKLRSLRERRKSTRK
jgi:hypothetical protein